MCISVAGYLFRGPYSRAEMLSHRSGIYAVLRGRDLPPLDAGVADDVRRAVEEHPARPFWELQDDPVSFAVFYTEIDATRERVREAIREAYGLPREEGEYRFTVPPRIRGGG